MHDHSQDIFNNCSNHQENMKHIQGLQVLLVNLEESHQERDIEKENRHEREADVDGQVHS